jgi:hypothetical protein
MLLSPWTTRISVTVTFSWDPHLHQRLRPCPKEHRAKRIFVLSCIFRTFKETCGFNGARLSGSPHRRLRSPRTAFITSFPNTIPLLHFAISRLHYFWAAEHAILHLYPLGARTRKRSPRLARIALFEAFVLVFTIRQMPSDDETVTTSSNVCEKLSLL